MKHINLSWEWYRKNRCFRTRRSNAFIPQDDGYECLYVDGISPEENPARGTCELRQNTFRVNRGRRNGGDRVDIFVTDGEDTTDRILLTATCFPGIRGNTFVCTDVTSGSVLMECAAAVSENRAKHSFVGILGFGQSIVYQIYRPEDYGKSDGVFQEFRYDEKGFGHALHTKSAWIEKLRTWDKYEVL